MKKFFLLMIFTSIISNAEMVQRGDGGVFISNEDQQTMADLLNDESNADEYDEKNNPDMEKIEDNEKFQLVKRVKEKKKSEYGKEDSDSDFVLPHKDGRKVISELERTERGKRKIRLKEYSNIQYDDSMFYYSLRQPTPDKFNRFLKRNNFNRTIFKNLVGYGSTIQQAKVSALYYDYYKENPSLAENFYKIMFKRKNELSLTDKLTLADYLLRTGRGDKASKILKKGTCLATVGNNKYYCLYYLGVEKYLKTGKTRNSELRISKKRIKQAKKLYYQKRK
jgi:hypothetical protein